ncbi:MAG: DUF3999 domain-containing protein [Geobacteraceae bacterium]|nr:DUF3999 domain-containing protein [Geobacteraceae bacterium]
MIRAALLLLILCANQAMAATPLPKDFAWKSSLNLPPGGTLYELTLPAAVYRGTVSPDLADICVFNGRDEMVPFTLTTPPLQAVKKLAPLPHFPLPETPLPGEKLSIRIERRTTGEIVTVSQNRTTAKPPAAYLLDTTSIKEPIESLEFEWSDIPAGFVERVSVEGSDDLEHWRHVTTATLAALQRGDNRVEQRQIQLSGIKMRYLRIVQLDPGSIINVTRVTATLAAGSAEPAHERLAIDVTAIPGQTGEFTFDLGGQMPLDRIRLLLPERNSLVKVAYFSRPRESDPWIQRIEGVSYRLDSQAGELSSPELTLPANRDRYWKLKISEAGGGTGTGKVKVAVAWRPQKILFLHRGDAPFTLAFGSGRVDTRTLRGADLLSTLPATDPAKVKIVRAEAGEAITLSGEAALKKELSAVTKKKLLLWGLLLLGVGLLALMALRLGKQMQSNGG